MREDDALAGGEDESSGAEVLFKVNDGGFVVVLVLIENFEGCRAAPFVDGLIDVTEEAELAVVLCEKVEDAVFGAGGVLYFVDLDPVVAGLPPGEAAGVFIKEGDYAEDEVCEVDGVGVSQHGYVVGDQGSVVDVG